MDSGRFRQLLNESGPFASVYFDDLAEDCDADAQLDLKWNALRHELTLQGADESVTAEIEYAVKDLRSLVGRGGRAVVASATGVLLNECLLRPVSEPVVRVSELPYLIPILEHGVGHSNYLLVVADPEGAFITSHTDATRFSEAVQTNCCPVHGDNAAGNGHRCPKPCPVAERVNELVSATSFGAVFLVGSADTRADLLASLPEQVRALATSLPVTVGRGGYDFDEIQRAVDTTMLRQRLSVMDTAAARFTAEVDRQSGLAADGLGAVCLALSNGTIDTMIIGDIDNATVVADEGMTTVAPSAQQLSQQGAAPSRTLRADEALPLLAISGGASLVRTDERITPTDGICAVLRNGFHR
jgi:peptide chain release factor subunit 1